MLKKAFVVSPLPRALSEQIASKLGFNFEEISFSFLKNLGILPALKILRSVSEMYVILEDEESEKFMDIFLIFFVFTQSKTLNLVRENLSVVSLRKRQAFFALLKSIGATFIGFFCALKLFCLSKMLFIRKPVYKLKESNAILYLKTNFWFGVKIGGSIGHTEGVVSGFRNKGWVVDYAGTECLPSMAPYIRKYFALPFPKSLSPLNSLNLYIFDSIVCRFLKKKNLKDYSFIYHRMSLNSISALIISRLVQIPLVLEYNGSEVWVQRHWGKPVFLEKISQSLENTILRHADYVVTVSSVLQQELVSRGISESKIICYPNCVNPDKFSPALFDEAFIKKKRKALGLTKEDTVITFVGTFGKWHGVEVLATAIQQLWEEDEAWFKEKKVRFLFIGNGACMPNVRAILSSLPPDQDFVKFVGLVPQEKAVEYLAISDILLSPQAPSNPNERFFGSPTKLFEYMAMEKVIIASDLDQIAEVLSPSVHIREIESIKGSDLAILCTPGSIEELAEAIKYAVRRLPHLKYMGTLSREKALRYYTWDSHVECILSRIKKELIKKT